MCVVVSECTAECLKHGPHYLKQKLIKYTLEFLGGIYTKFIFILTEYVHYVNCIR